MESDPVYLTLQTAFSAIHAKEHTSISVFIMIAYSQVSWLVLHAISPPATPVGAYIF